MYDELFFLIYLNTYKSIKDTSPRGLRMLYTYYYKRAIHTKMRSNKIHFPMGFNLTKDYRILTCIKRNSLTRRSLAIVEEMSKKEEEESPYNLSEIELERFTTKYCKPDDEVHVYYDEPLN